MIGGAALLLFTAQYVSMTVLKGQQERAVADTRREDNAARLRLDNELRATVWASQAGVTVPLRDGDLRAVPVKPWNLVEAFKGDGGYEYKGRLVAVPLIVYVVQGNAILWHAGSSKSPPVIAFRFDAPPKASGKVWVEGRVDGAERDGLLRDKVGVDYRVILIDCHVLGGE